MASEIFDVNGRPIYPEAGDLFGFSGSGWVSKAITLLTYGWPGWGISHVAIVAPYDGVPSLYESTTLTDLVCKHAKRRLKGVQVHDIKDRIEAYEGRIWYYAAARLVSRFSQVLMEDFLREQLGKEYDAIGALRSGGKLFSFVESLLREEDLSDIYCSELAAAVLRLVRLLSTNNVSKWNPAALLRHQVRTYAAERPRRVK